MGFFDGLFGSSPSFQTFTFDQTLPKPLRGRGRRLVGTAFDTFQNAAQSGETPESASLAGAARQRTIRGFQDATRRSQSDLHRAGAGSSTAARESQTRLADALLGQLTLQDATREQALFNRQLAGAQAGLGGVLGTSQAGSVVGIPGTPGALGDLAGGLGAGLGFAFGGPLGGALGGLGGGALDAAGVGAGRNIFGGLF